MKRFFFGFVYPPAKKDASVMKRGMVRVALAKFGGGTLPLGEPPVARGPRGMCVGATNFGLRAEVVGDLLDAVDFRTV